jgi:hypothetical protein
MVIVAALVPGRGLASEVTCDDSKNMTLPAGDANTNLQVTGPCQVKAGTYTFRSVNIFGKSAQNKASLTFTDDPMGIDFFAESIVVENHGSLIAGSAGMPIGSTCDNAGKCGTVTIHLWGTATDSGVTCRSDTKGQCGIPDGVWMSNLKAVTNPTINPASCTPTMVLPGDVNDCFYAYRALDESDEAAQRKAYFGHKVLALSYGGTLQLFGTKGATYAGRELSTCMENDPKCSGTSWLHLQGSLKPAATSLTVNGKVNWQDGDHIVVTTTDYLPGHSEELIIKGAPTVSGNTSTISFTNADGKTSGVAWPHNGQVYDYSNVVPEGLGLQNKQAETRAAVALLTRSIVIVSEGDTPVADSFPATAGNYFGGHTIVRQGFRSYQVQGVEFDRLGQGGSIMHYPVHFHLARRTPQPVAPKTEPVTFVKDSSVRDSMTRWITIHGTQGVLIARNVGYLSIGHGYYLEDGTETDNKLYSNLGIFARAAVDNVQNLRTVPGILTRGLTPKEISDGANKNSGFDNFPFFSDSNHPSVFWIMNGANQFEYNMAAGAGSCGACYWFVPGAISGPSRQQKWFGYASEQQGQGRAAISPLREFLGNTCVSAMNGFQVNQDTATCNGVNFITAPAFPNTTLVMLPSAQAKKNYPPKADDTYWPITTGLHHPTRCKEADKNPNTDFNCGDEATTKVCANSAEGNCDVLTLDQFTTSFNWAQQNFAAIWLRPLWALVVNSVVSDVQNGGINFVTSGDFSKAAVINGFWALARKTVYIGTIQWRNAQSALSDNPLTSNAGAFNPFVSKTLKSADGSGFLTGLACAVDPVSGANNVSYCLSKNDGVSVQLSNFSDFQRFFSIYDGPAYQDSNAYLNIHPTYLTSDGTVNGSVINTKAGRCEPNASGNPCPFSGFMNGGLAGLRADLTKRSQAPNGLCYLPNAAIGWKQPNGFYYSPAFHSINLFYNDVDIRHFVIEPLFNLGTFDTNVGAMMKQYCYFSITAQPGTFTGFTDIDRETVLNDDDGSLTPA